MKISNIIDFFSGKENNNTSSLDLTPGPNYFDKKLEERVDKKIEENTKSTNNKIKNLEIGNNLDIYS